MRTITDIILIVMFFSSLCLEAQEGCTDPQAVNYDQDAIENDGSCIYPITNHTLLPICDLQNPLEEISGTVYFNNKLWGITDSGGEDKIYEIDTSNCSVTRSIIIANVDNIDWEDMAQSESHVFIADIGNNQGNRTDLAIYKISKDDLINNLVVDAEIINIQYEDQTSFDYEINEHNFDAEAIFHWEDHIRLFSKNWLTNDTKYYKFSDTEGNYTIAPITTFDVGCLVTAADINEQGIMSLLGYTENGLATSWIFTDFSDNHFFDGNKRKINLGTVFNTSQVEAITYSNPKELIVGSENHLSLNAKLLFFDINPYFDQTTKITDQENNPKPIVYPNPSDGLINLEFGTKCKMINIYTIEGKLVYSKNNQARTFNNTVNLCEGMYFVKFQYDKLFIIQKIVVVNKK